MYFHHLQFSHSLLLPPLIVGDWNLARLEYSPFPQSKTCKWLESCFWLACLSSHFIFYSLTEHEESSQTTNKAWPQFLSKVCLHAGRKAQMSFSPLFIDSVPYLNPRARLAVTFPPTSVITNNTSSGGNFPSFSTLLIQCGSQVHWRQS